MADKEGDEFTYLEVLTSKSGPHLDKELFKPKNVGALADLFTLSEPRFRAIESKLKAFGWVQWSTWSKKVQKAAKDAAETAIDDSVDEELEQRRKDAEDEGIPVLHKGRPVEIAEAFKRMRRPHAVYWAEDWLDWEGSFYQKLEPGLIQAEMQRFMSSAVDFNTAEPMVIGPREVDHAVSALKNVTFQVAGMDGELELPMWLDEGGFEPPAKECIAFRNGVLGIRTRKFLTPSADFFTRVALGFDYDPLAECPTVLAFLSSLEQEREGWVDMMQEHLGYMLSPYTNMQKMFNWSGKGGSGKGTLVWLICQAVGSRNVLPRSFDSMFNSSEARFVKEDMFTSSLVVFADVVMHKNHIHLARQFFLNTVGEDAQSSDRKGKSRITGTLQARVLTAGNEEMVLPDQSGEIKRRSMPARFIKQFEGTKDQDIHLKKKMLKELPGFINWCLIGLDRLVERGEMILCPDSFELRENISMQGAPVGAFLTAITEKADFCDVPVVELWKAFKGWHISRRGAEPWIRDISEFSRAVERISQGSAHRRGDSDSEPMVFDGIRIKKAFIDKQWPQMAWDSGED